MKLSIKVILAAAFVGTLGVGGLVRTVYASQPQTQMAIMPQHRSSSQIAQGSAQDSKFNQQGTEASDGDGETKDDDVKEQQEAANLQPLAKITPQQAQQAAETAQGGKARSVKLENENGNLVYAVNISQKEVKVDAGDGQVLYTENANQEDNKNAASRPKSSIQVPKTNEGDREVNDDGAK